MILPIYGYGHQLLRKVSEDITPDYPKLDELIQNMYETMRSSHGVGLAAPQVGLNIRLFVVDATPYEEEVGSKYQLKQVFINPVIIEESGEPWMFEEGCLSIPEIREDIERLSIVKLKYLDEDFKPDEQVFDGIFARIIQHEYDHLEGVMFVDHVSNLRKILLRKKLNDIVTGKVKPGYKMKFANLKR